VNSKIREISEALTVAPDPAFSLLCECGSDGCSERIDVPAALYEGLQPAEFVVAPGHERLGLERIVVEQPTFLVVASSAQRNEEPAPGEADRPVERRQVARAQPR
jgi:hypothetical protein